MNRRAFLSQAAIGLGGAALSSLLGCGLNSSGSTPDQLVSGYVLAVCG